jgi:tRNA-dihydrouridine synthase B
VIRTGFKLKENAVILAPLAGVSDYPFRLLSQRGGADLGYVEMISSKALIYNNAKTLAMLYRGQDEINLGVQITASEPEDIKQAVAILQKYPFDTIDINMGCPVKKVTKTGCGSAILRNVDTVYDMVRLAVSESDCPISAKIRLGWDRTCLNYLEVADAIERAGASWLCVHGRTRSEDYSAAVDLNSIYQIKKRSSIPVIGNGNIFSHTSASIMREKTGVDGLMISRGALGNPWVFRDIKDLGYSLTLAEWYKYLREQIEIHSSFYKHSFKALMTVRKHLLWYLKRWPGARKIKDQLMHASSFEEINTLILGFVECLEKDGVSLRQDIESEHSGDRPYVWDPKFDMSRKHDTAVAVV